nr:hypothetical protein [Dongia deserti]
MAVEIFEDLDRHFAAVLQAVPELRRIESAVLGIARNIDRDLRHLCDGLRQEEVIQRNLVHFTAAGHQAEDPAHDLLVDPELTRNVAHARRAEAVELAQQWLGTRPDPLLLRRHAHFVMWPPQPGAVQNHGAGTHHPLDRRREQWRGQTRMKR